MRMKTSKYSIRRLRPSDYGELLSVWERAGLPSRPKGRDSREEMARQLRLATSIYLKVVFGEGTRGPGQREREKMVAVVLGTHDGRKGWINRLAVLPEHRRTGIGRMLVVELERRFKKLGLDICSGLVEDWNDGSFRFFRKLGYTVHRDILYISKRKSPRT